MTAEFYIPKALGPTGAPFHASPLVALSDTPPFELLFGNTVAVPSFSGQRLAALIPVAIRHRRRVSVNG